MGNLFSVRQACEHAGLRAVVTSDSDEVRASEAVILPGVGAFGDAMAALARQGLVEVLQELAASGRPFLGICLGMQLLFTESEEFGRHAGLGIIPGRVTRLAESDGGAVRVKVPQVGWNRLQRPAGASWERSALEGIPDGVFMYFVHSFCVTPEDPDIILSTTRYGSTAFCSSLRRGNLFACQFHPERSGPSGVQIYRNFARQVERAAMEVERV
jgi:glutamine amidotransferase